VRRSRRHFSRRRSHCGHWHTGVARVVAPQPRIVRRHNHDLFSESVAALRPDWHVGV
jgi:hypothetical protein